MVGDMYGELHPSFRRNLGAKCDLADVPIKNQVHILPIAYEPNFFFLFPFLCLGQQNVLIGLEIPVRKCLRFKKRIYMKWLLRHVTHMVVSLTDKMIRDIDFNTGSISFSTIPFP